VTRIDAEIVIAAPVEQLFDMVADERNEPQYNPRIVRGEDVGRACRPRYPLHSAAQRDGTKGGNDCRGG
jgi:hypothetical protein